MKRITFLATVLLSVVALAVNGQQEATFRSHLTTKVDIFSDMWQDTPDILDSKTINRGVNVATTYNFPMKNTALSFDMGLGIGVHNLYHENSLVKNEEGLTQFGEIPPEDYDGELGEDKISVDKAKLSFAYLDVPMELKLETESDFRAAVGFKLGMLINSLSKYEGTNYMDDREETVKLKEKDLSNTNRFRYGPSIRLGYKWINLYGYYSLNTVFEENQGPAIYPLSIGISIVQF